MSNDNEMIINGVVYVKKSDVTAPVPAELDGLKYAIVRSRDQGVMCGFVKEIGGPQGRQVILARARQMWRWSSRFVLTDIAEHGLTDRWERKFSCEASQDTVMLEACGVLYCTEVAMTSLRAEPAQDHSHAD